MKFSSRGLFIKNKVKTLLTSNERLSFASKFEFVQYSGALSFFLLHYFFIFHDFFIFNDKVFFTFLLLYYSYSSGSLCVLKSLPSTVRLIFKLKENFSNTSNKKDLFSQVIN